MLSINPYLEKNIIFYLFEKFNSLSNKILLQILSIIIFGIFPQDSYHGAYLQLLEHYAVFSEKKIINMYLHISP